MRLWASLIVTIGGASVYILTRTYRIIVPGKVRVVLSKIKSLTFNVSIKKSKYLCKYVIFGLGVVIYRFQSFISHVGLLH